MMIKPRCLCFLLALSLVASLSTAAPPTVSRVSTVVPFPRGLVLQGDDLYVLARGRVRDSGGVDVKLDDQAGSLWKLDARVADPLDEGGGASSRNGAVFATATDPPFHLLDRSLPNAADDRRTDRPYCGLRYHAASKSFFICAFSGIDLSTRDADTAEHGAFRKNYADAVLRYDTRTGRWSELDRHDPRQGDNYPHADEPRGWAKGPDNLLVVGDALLVAAKDNSRIVAYDLRGYIADPNAEPPTGRIVLEDRVTIDGAERRVSGHSALAARDGWLYVAFRTTSEVIRLPIFDDSAGGFGVDARRAQLLALFEPFVPATEREPARGSANLTDMDIGPDGDVYVVSAWPARVYRFSPDSNALRDYREGGGGGRPWVDLAAATGTASLKSENVLVAADGRVFVTSGDAYGHAAGLGGAIYVVEEN